MTDAVAEAMKAPEFIVYPEPEGLPLDITAEFREHSNNIRYFQEKITASMGIPAEFITPRPTGKLYWMEAKYEDQPFKLEFRRLKQQSWIKTNTGKIIF